MFWNLPTNPRISPSKQIAWDHEDVTPKDIHRDLDPIGSKTELSALRGLADHIAQDPDKIPPGGLAQDSDILALSATEAFATSSDSANPAITPSEIEIDKDPNKAREALDKFFGASFIEGIIKIFQVLFTKPIRNTQLFPGMMAMAFASPKKPAAMNETNASHYQETFGRHYKTMSQWNLPANQVAENLLQFTGDRGFGDVYYSNSFRDFGTDTNGKTGLVEDRIRNIVADLNNVGSNTAQKMSRFTSGYNLNLFPKGETVLLHTQGDEAKLTSIVQNFNQSLGDKYARYKTLDDLVATLPSPPTDKNDPEYAQKLEEYNRIRQGSSTRPDGLNHQDIRQEWTLYKTYLEDLSSDNFDETKIINVDRNLLSPQVLKTQEAVQGEVRTKLALARLTQKLQEAKSSGQHGTMIFSKGDIYFMPDR